jgi:hypothetical protein
LYAVIERAGCFNTYAILLTEAIKQNLSVKVDGINLGQLNPANTIGRIISSCFRALENNFN